MGSLTATYGLFYRRPPWSFHRVALLTGFATITGLLYGQFKRVQAHVTFVKSLEDRASFMTALENVNKRTSGFEPVLTEAAHQRRDPDTETAFPERTAESTSDNYWPEREVDAQSKGPTSPFRRWDEIRAASTRSVAQSSSWDALREKHERDRVRNSKNNEKHSDERRSAE